MSTFPTATTLNSGSIVGGIVVPCSLIGARNEATLANILVGLNLAITTNPLSQFAATTSAQLAGIISDETGSGSLVFNMAFRI